MTTPELTVLNAQFCHKESLVHKEHHKDYQLWYDPIDKREYCQYKLYGWPNDKQIESYQFRKDQKGNLVYVHYLANIQNAGFKQFQVFVERIPLLLSSIQKLSFSQALYIIKQSLIGFQMLFQKFGYVYIDDKLIGFTPEGYVRVWMNQTFAYNGVAETHMAPKWMNQDFRARQMICGIFSTIEDRLQKNNRQREFKREREIKLTTVTFENAIEFINKYVENSGLKISKAVPQLLRWKVSDAFRKRWIKNKERITQPLTFKKLSGSPKKKPENRINLTITLAKDSEKQKGAGTSRLLLGTGSRLLSPSASSAQGKMGIRPRNQSEAAISVAESRAKTCQTTIRFKRSSIKYFYDKDKQDFQNQNGTLQSSLISRDQDFRSNNHFRFQPAKNKLQQFQFTQVQNQKSKPNHKKRKFSGADCMTFYAKSAPQKQTNINNNTSLARSMVIKNKLESSNRFDRNPEAKLEGLQSSKPFFEMQAMVRQSNTTFGRPPSPAQQKNPQLSYKVDKPFLNYKTIKSSFISNAKVDLKQAQAELQPPANLKNSLLKNADMKSSQIIMERSSEYASIKDIMKTIKQSQIETPMSEVILGGFGNHHDKQMSMFTGSPEKRRVSDHNISNSTTDRKSSFHSEKKEGLLNFTSPKNTVKSGMFKSIIIDDPKIEIKEVPEGEHQG